LSSPGQKAAIPSPEQKPSAQPSPEQIPSAVPTQSTEAFYWAQFMSRLKPLHAGFKTYRISSPAGIGMCEFYVRLGMMQLSTRVHMAVYVHQSYCAKAIFASIADNYQPMVEELKTTAKNESGILDLRVEPVIFVYSDDPMRQQLEDAVRQARMNLIIDIR